VGIGITRSDSQVRVYRFSDFIFIETCDAVFVVIGAENIMN